MSLRLIKIKTSPYWYIRGTVRAETVFETTGTDNKKAAEAIRIKRENELLHRSIFGASATRTFAEAAASYIEAGGEAKYIGTWDDATGIGTLLLGIFYHTAIGAIGQTEADDAAKNLYPGTAASTRKRALYVPLKAVLNHAAMKNWGHPQVIRAPKVKPTIHKWATPEWFAKLLPHCSPKVKLFALISAYTGRRLSECCGLIGATTSTWENGPLSSARPRLTK